MKIKKILFVTEYFPPFVMGGAEISLKILVDELVKKGHEVVVLTPNYKSFKTEIEKRNNLKIIKFKSFRSFLFKKREKTSYKMYKKTKPIFYLIMNQYIKYSSHELKKNIEKLLEKKEFDVIHANNLESILALNNIKTSVKIAYLRDFGLFCYNRGLNNNGNLCYGCSKNNLKNCMNAKGLINRLLLIEMKKRINNLHGLSSFDLLIAISNFVKEQYVNILGIDKNKIKVLYNPISNNVISSLSKKKARRLLNLPENKKIILFVGSLTEKKGAHLIPKIAKKLKDYLFIVIGDGVLKDLFLKNKQNNNIIYMGYLPISELRHYYKASDILLVPSLWHEPFGRVVLEGAYNGCYIIGSNRGGIPEVIDWLKCGIYVDPTVENFVMEIKRFDKNKLKKDIKKLEKYEYYKEFIKIIR